MSMAPANLEDQVQSRAPEGLTGVRRSVCYGGSQIKPVWLVWHIPSHFGEAAHKLRRPTKKNPTISGDLERRSQRDMVQPNPKPQSCEPYGGV